MTPVAVSAACIHCPEGHPIVGHELVPGLTVGLTDGWHDWDEYWAVIHTRSGLLLLGTGNDPEAAAAAALELGPLADWTLPADKLAHTMRPGVMAVVNRWRVDDGLLHQACDDNPRLSR